MLQALVRLHGAPIGYVKVSVSNGRCTSATLTNAILEQHVQAILKHLLCDGLAANPPSQLGIRDLPNVSHPDFKGPLPRVSAVVCTRDRTADLARCLDSLNLLDYPDLELLVVDNAPGNDATERLVRENYPYIRYVCETRPGLNWARNRAVLEATGEIIAYTDDDCVVDPGWLRALGCVFAEDPAVMAVTGLVVPYELETEAQILFEQSGGFGRGFDRKWYLVNVEGGQRIAPLHGGSGKFGTGANMAYRRDLFNWIGYFDPALDMGTPTEGGGDLELFFRVIKQGYTLVYEPSALVRHANRTDYGQLRKQMFGWGAGFYAYMTRSCLTYSDERTSFVKLGLRWLWERSIRRFLLSFVNPRDSCRDLILTEFWGSLIGCIRYLKSRSEATKIRDTFGPQFGPNVPEGSPPLKRTFGHKNGTAVRVVDLDQPIETLTDITDYPRTRILVVRNGNLLGDLDIANCCLPISGTRLREAIATRLNISLLAGNAKPVKLVEAEVLTGLAQHYSSKEEKDSGDGSSELPVDVSVSVVVATYDRPHELRNCLRCLTSQESPRKVEIVVVDNRPVSGVTPPVVAEFPSVVLVREPCKGLSYARNAGICASNGDIIITTDDDVTMPHDWLERLVASFVRSDVMITTGNVLPLELETAAQGLFETYGGLGRGFERLVVDGSWFESFGRRAVPTWRLGSTANAAFRATIFADPEIGLLDEGLGAGTPTGCSEDTYLFYKVLKAGYTLVYEPGAYVWHKHREEISALRRQIYNYSKGHVAYHLTTLIGDHDPRAIVRLIMELPRYHIRRIAESVLGRSGYPLSLTLLEILGNLAGPFALWRSRRRVKRKGKSKTYIPFAHRSIALQKTNVC